METSKNIIQEYNNKLFEKLFPDKSEPIFCNSVINPKEAIFQKSFKDIALEYLSEIILEQEFYLELEQIKHNLKID